MMKSSALSFLRPLLLIIISTGLLVIKQPSTAVFAGGNDAPFAQDGARETIASCDNQTYKVPLMPEGTDSDEHYAVSPNVEGPVIADMGLYIEEIPEINELDNTFTIEGFMDIVWCDPRLKFENRGQGTSQILLEDDVQEKLNVIWWPDLTFANEVSTRDSADRELVIHENGTVEYREKFTVSLEAKYNLSKFPFDKQVLYIEIESFAWDEKYLQLHIEDKNVGFSTEFQIPEWRTDSVSTSIEEVMEVGNRAPFSEFLMTINVTREFGFYLWKVLLPLIILVMMCFAVFWMDDESLADRLGVSFTGVLTVVAYQFIATGNLPKVPYITLMDTYITTSFVIMVLTIFQSVVVGGYNKTGKKETALKIDRISHLTFPLVYIISIGLLTIVFMLSD